MHRYPLLLVLVSPAACALMGGPSLIDDAVVDSATPLGDADLMADVEALHGVRAALANVGDELFTDAVKGSDYLARIGRILGM